MIWGNLILWLPTRQLRWQEWIVDFGNDYISRFLSFNPFVSNMRNKKSPIL